MTGPLKSQVPNLLSPPQCHTKSQTCPSVPFWPTCSAQGFIFTTPISLAKNAFFRPLSFIAKSYSSSKTWLTIYSLWFYTCKFHNQMKFLIILYLFCNHTAYQIIVQLITTSSFVLSAWENLEALNTISAAASGRQILKGVYGQMEKTRVHKTLKNITPYKWQYKYRLTSVRTHAHACAHTHLCEVLLLKSRSLM